MAETTLFAAEMTLIGVNGSQVVFGGGPDAPRHHWGEHQGGPREIAGATFQFDKRYWELLGSPEKLSVGFSTDKGWKAHTGSEVPDAEVQGD